jgi:hypothetical protein
MTGIIILYSHECMYVCMWILQHCYMYVDYINNKIHCYIPNASLLICRLFFSINNNILCSCAIILIFITFRGNFICNLYNIIVYLYEIYFYCIFKNVLVKFIIFLNVKLILKGSSPSIVCSYGRRKFFRVFFFSHFREN